MNQTLSCLEIGASRDEAELVVVLMHGLGADAHDFEEVAGAITRAAMPRQWRFVLPAHYNSMPGGRSLSFVVWLPSRDSV